jgi:hypothetical protein
MHGSNSLELLGGWKAEGQPFAYLYDREKKISGFIPTERGGVKPI